MKRCTFRWLQEYNNKTNEREKNSNNREGYEEIILRQKTSVKWKIQVHLKQAMKVNIEEDELTIIDSHSMNNSHALT